MSQENKDQKPVEGAGATKTDKTLDTEGADAGANSGADAAAAGAGGDDKPAAGAGDDETVTIKKSDLKKIEEERDNYKQGLIAAKGDKKGKKPVGTDDPSAPVTKGDLYKTNERAAIKTATTIDKDDSPEVAAIKKDLDEHWDDIKVHYTGQSGRGTVEDIVEDIFDAHAVWMRRNGKTAKKGDTKTAKADLAADRGRGGQGQAATPLARTRILPKFQTPADWYKKRE